jgi:multicomponent Na+:H+ antiporter subunit A
MLITILVCLIGAFSFLALSTFFQSKFAGWVALLPLGIFSYFVWQAPAVASGEIIQSHYPWVPTLGLHLDFVLDGLALLFCLLISGIGAFIFWYASSYLRNHPYLHRFYCYLALFMAAMLGLVLSDNILLLFIFWELTSISSFFLIGFNNDQAESRKSSLIALAVTGGGGFLLLVGFILLGQIAGTYSLQEMSNINKFIQANADYCLILVLICFGAFTKSAQFPFHFWLPGAMKAPTPVSAYLHSATMVKAGVYLLARIFPVLGGTDLWMYLLMITGGITMLYGAFHSLFRTDLKGILAYSTISALGILVFLIGMGSAYALQAAMVFILAHALYKATLFLITGIIDHETGTREVTVLSGLRKVLPPVAFAGALAALSSAGLPYTFGFIGKDLIYESTLHTPFGDPRILTGIAFLTNTLLLYAGLLAGVKPFTGALPRAFEKVHLPAKSMWIPPIILAVLGVLFGTLPYLIDQPLLRQATLSIHAFTTLGDLKIWHGFNTVLLLSGSTLGLGFLLYFVLRPSTTRLQILAPLERISPMSLFRKSYLLSFRIAEIYSTYWHNGMLRSYILRITLFILVLIGYKLVTGGPIEFNLREVSPITIYEVVVCGLLIVAVYMVLTTTNRLTAVVATSVIGYCICLLFVFYSAPDLALTQFTIDTLTVVLFVLVLFRLPPFLNFANRGVKIRDAFVSISLGLCVALIALQVLNEPQNREVSKFYGDNAYLLAKGKNVVNVILVDFRGFDTMFEIIVLAIASLGVYSLMKLRMKSSEKD